MKKSIVAIMAVVVLAAVASAASACPASYVQGIGHQNESNGSAGKAREVADRYMDEKGIPSASAAGQIIRPYVIGTTIVDDQWGIHDLDGKSVDAAVHDCLGCWHHSQHFDDGKRDAETRTAKETVRTAG